MSTNKDGIILVLSSPSGAGKTTLVKLLSKNRDFHIPISHTTRKPRANEVQGKDLEINLYINVCVDYINLKNISSHIEKLNTMFNEIEDQQEMTVRLAEILKSKTDEYDKCEKRMESLIKKLNGDRAARLKDRHKDNASILSLVRNFQLEEGRRKMIDLATREKEAVGEEIERLESMESWKARILGISKDNS